MRIVFWNWAILTEEKENFNRDLRLKLNIFENKIFFSPSKESYLGPEELANSYSKLHGYLAAWKS